MATHKNTHLNKVTMNRSSSSSPHPMIERGLCRVTSYTNENKDVIQIDFEDLKTIKELGSGQYGLVLKCVHIKSNLKLAVKRISNSPENEEERKKEVRVLEELLKPDYSEFIVKFYGALFAESYLWILSEVMDASLDTFYSKAKTKINQLEEPFLSKVAYSVLMGIDFLRSKNIMHRDIKPSNMLINRDSKIKLCDFGISGFINNSICLTITGCCPYMAPEKITSTDSDHNDGYTIKADIWSLGISMIEIATFKHPFEYAKSYFEKVQAIAIAEPPKLPEQFTVDFRLFVDKCLKKKLDERGDLKQLLNHAFILKNLHNSIDLKFIEGIIEEIDNES